MKIRAVAFAGAFALLAAPFFATAALADFVVDQSNDAIAAAPAIPTTAVGGGSSQRLAQTFTVGMTGSFAKLRLPLGCASGTLVIEIVEQSPAGLPSGAVLRRTSVPAASVRSVIPTPATMIDIFLVSPLNVTAGDRLAIVLTNESGECAVARADAGETYAGGEAYFIGLPDAPDWVTLDRDGVISVDPSDLPFQTLMEVPGSSSSSNCLPGFPGGGDPPVCRCLRDEGLREFRCAFLHPDFFAIRRIPWPIPLDRSYAESWEVLPMTKLDGAIRLELKGANIAKPVVLTFIGKSLKALELRKAVLKAPSQPANIPGSATLTYGNETFVLDTSIPAAQFGDAPPPKVQEIKDRL